MNIHTTRNISALKSAFSSRYLVSRYASRWNRNLAKNLATTSESSAHSKHFKLNILSQKLPFDLRIRMKRGQKANCTLKS